ncbi:serine/threonine-protein kinase H1 homolog [Tachysurus ichikawai]
MSHTTICGLLSEKVRQCNKSLPDVLCVKLTQTGGSPWPSVSNLAKDFIDRVLTVDPSERLTAGQALKHPWIVSMAASSSMKNLQRCISQNLLKRASSRCQSTKSAQSTRSSRSSKSGRARRVREKELRELNRRYQQQYNG